MVPEYDKFVSRIFSNADQNGIPLSGAFELTSRCPLDCKMCYIHRRENDREAMKGEKDAAWWLRLAEEARNAGMFMLLLTGGEPLLRQDFEEIYLGARRLGLLVSVNTNGVLIGEKYVRLFSDYPPHRLNISLYGASRETYESICGCGAAYDKTVNALKSLKAEGIGLRINFTANQYNAHDAAQIYAFAKELGVNVQPVSYMFPPVRAPGAKAAERFTPEEAAKVQFDCKLLKTGKDMLKKQFEYKSGLALPGECTGENGERIPCRAGLSTFWVTWNGVMTPCGMMNSPAVEVESFLPAWERIKASREEIIMPAKCSSCELRVHCDVCAAVTQAETGDFSGVPEYLCRKAAAYKALCEKLLNSS